MAYTKVHPAWEDSPSTATPINAAALDQIEEGVETAHELAGTAQSTATSAASAAAAAQTTANGRATVTSVTTAQNAANAAQSTADTALANAATAQTTANGRATVASVTTAQNAANAAQSTANAAQTTANAAIPRAEFEDAIENVFVVSDDTYETKVDADFAFVAHEGAEDPHNAAGYVRIFVDNGLGTYVPWSGGGIFLWGSGDADPDAQMGLNDIVIGQGGA